ncbi:MAG: amino acid ABC transporter substrate-binding protein [Chloroflexi bacterium]|nr:amino acid ABC transporter substrate-binding protein [Chloroflexota bacterium]
MSERALSRQSSVGIAVSRRAFLSGLTASFLVAACTPSASAPPASSSSTGASTAATAGAAGPTSAPATTAPAASPAAAAKPAASPAAAASPASGASPAPAASLAASPAAAAPAAFAGSFDGTILFGAPIALTGSLAKEGGLTRDGYEIWKDTYNQAGGIMVGGKRYKIETKYYDDESNAQKSATLAEKLIKEDNINLLLGPYGTSSTLQVSTVAEKNKLPMVEGNGAAESIFNQGYKYSFGVLSPARNYLRGVVDMALAQSPKPASVAVLTADDPFSVEVADAAREYAEEQGLQVVYFQKYPDKSTDLRAPLTEAKGKSPDLFLNSGHLQESLAITQQAKELGFNARAFAFSVGPSIADYQTTLKQDANFIFGGTQWTPVLKYNGDDLFKTPANYNTLYQQKYNYEPAYQSAESTACGIAYVKALEKAGSLDVKAVRDALAGLDFISFYGHIKFDDRGINIYKPMAVEQWQNGEKMTVWPSDAANARPLWPTPPWNQR